MPDNVLIVIPARYQSTRLPGKPLALINGVPMIERVARIAGAVCRATPGCSLVVATDHQFILDFCKGKNIPAVMTSETCKSGTERCLEAADKTGSEARFIVNLQGDNPLCPPRIVQALIDAWIAADERGGGDVADVFTPAVKLTWDEYDRLLAQKQTTPHSGTTVTVAHNGNALYFSKAVIPSIRKKEQAMRTFPASPVRRHIGLYAYTRSALERYFAFEAEGRLSEYEQSSVEALEQLRFLYNGMTVRVIDVEYRGRKTMSGVDSPEDVKRAEEILNEFGELELELHPEDAR
ncbi:MAG: 3-deoxy-manno-octulosonate cytidylyltransferase [Planctomycetota bacterium]|jgi:3-deoxy-manno-octulosonate cytidylyltransferase (CMP-KDO synthetase)|nr:3-deoxy-manno-octulosonate cytidylyltransferase [Planctomycetota bacterium]